MASPTFRKLDKDVLLKMLSDLAVTSKERRAAAATEQPEKRSEAESEMGGGPVEAQK
jgi:hypothetical protein